MSEIKDLLEKHDIAGLVVLHEPGYTEYALRLDPSYSCAKLERGQLKFKTKGMNVSDKKKRQFMTDTANMMQGLATTSGQMAMNLMNGSDKINHITGALHTDFGHTSRDELDN